MGNMTGSSGSVAAVAAWQQWQRGSSGSTVSRYSYPPTQSCQKIISAFFHFTHRGKFKIKLAKPELQMKIKMDKKSLFVFPCRGKKNFVSYLFAFISISDLNEMKLFRTEGWLFFGSREVDRVAVEILRSRVRISLSAAKIKTYENECGQVKTLLLTKASRWKSTFFQPRLVCHRDRVPGWQGCPLGPR